MERTAFLARSKPNHFRIPWVEVAGALTSQWSSAQRGNVLTPAVVETVHCKVTGWLSALWDFPISFPSKWQDLKFGPFSDAPADKTWKAMCSQMSTHPAYLWAWFAVPHVTDYFVSLGIVSFSSTYYYKMFWFLLPSEWVGKSIFHSQENDLDSILRASL